MMKRSQCRHGKGNASRLVLTLTASLKKCTTKQLQKAYMDLKPPFYHLKSTFCSVSSVDQNKKNSVVFFQQFGRGLCNFCTFFSVVRQYSHYVVTTITTCHYDCFNYNITAYHHQLYFYASC